MPRIKVLFFAEGATLAHVARPHVLAQSLDNNAFDVTLCRPDSFKRLFPAPGYRVAPLACQSPETFARKLERGLPLYDFDTLLRYVEHDLALIDKYAPHVVVGDFRLSLSTSCQLRSVPYIALCDAYWSPEYRQEMPLPALFFTRFLPIKIAERAFRAIAPMAFRRHAQPMEKLRRHFGLASFENDLLRCYSEADWRLFPNFAPLYPALPRQARAAFLGPLAWSPSLPAPALPPGPDTDLIYVTMGSSGHSSLLEKIIPLLESMGLKTVVSTAGKPTRFSCDPRLTQRYDYVSGSDICRNARLVICNGGSPSTNQALSAGVPVLGLPANMDQFLNMQAIARHGAGLMVRADRASARLLRSGVEALLDDPNYRMRAGELKANGTESNPTSVFARSITGLIQ